MPTIQEWEVPHLLVLIVRALDFYSFRGCECKQRYEEEMSEFGNQSINLEQTDS